MENVLDTDPGSPRLELFLPLMCPWKQISHLNTAWDRQLFLGSNILKEQNWESLEFYIHTPHQLCHPSPLRTPKYLLQILFTLEKRS